jgi:hypothetical protein
VFVRALLMAQDAERLEELFALLHPPSPSERRELTAETAADAGGDLLYV